MSWAMRRRFLYALSVGIFLLVIGGVPVAYYFLSQPPSCTDGVQNQGETGADLGGPCPLADENALAPSSVDWARSFKIRDGLYSATAYIENSNGSAGFEMRPYKFSLYDTQNILIAERTGYAYAMPGGITPVYEPDIDTGNRVAVHTFFEFTAPAKWLHLSDTASVIKVTNRVLTGETDSPRLEATITNTDVSPRTDVEFVAVIFDTAGNAFAASATKVDRMEPGESKQIVFTWPNAFTLQVGRIDIIPVSPPKRGWSAPCQVDTQLNITCK